MNSLSFPRTREMWVNLATSAAGLCRAEEKGCETVTGAAMLAIAALITAIVTPFFLLYDCVCGVPTATLNENRVVEVPDDGRTPGQRIFLDFYLGRCANLEGDTISGIHRFSDSELEARHNFIQWLFITEEPSGVLPSAPTSTPEIREAFRTNIALRLNLRASFIKILRFWGFEHQDEGNTIWVEKAASFEEKARNWLTRGNHNFLRIDRVLKSLCELGLNAHAIQFYYALEDLFLESDETRQGILRPSLYNHWRLTILRYNSGLETRVG